jgi:hypothetical protein
MIIPFFVIIIVNHPTAYIHIFLVYALSFRTVSRITLTENLIVVQMSIELFGLVYHVFVKALGM